MASWDQWGKVTLLGVGAGALVYVLTRFGGQAGIGATPLVVYASQGAGAGEFRRVANQIAGMYRVRPVSYRRLADLESALRQVDGSVGPVVLVGHGTTSAFFSNLDRPNPQELAALITPRLVAGGIVGLAGCRAAANPGEPDWAPASYGPGGALGYAARLRDEMVRLGARGAFEVRAHSTTGGASANPAVRVFTSRAGTPGASALDMLWGAGAWQDPANRSAWTAAFRGKSAEGYIGGGPLPQIARVA